MKYLVIVVCLMNIFHSFCADKITAQKDPQWMMDLRGYLAQKSEESKDIDRCEWAIHKSKSEQVWLKEIIIGQQMINQLAYGNNVRVACQEKGSELLYWFKDYKENIGMYDLGEVEIESIWAADNDKTIAAVTKMCDVSDKTKMMLSIFDISNNESKIDIKELYTIPLNIPFWPAVRVTSAVSLTDTHAIIGRSIDKPGDKLTYLLLRPHIELLTLEQKNFLRKIYTDYSKRKSDVSYIIVGLSTKTSEFDIYNELPEQIKEWLKTIAYIK